MLKAVWDFTGVVLAMGVVGSLHAAQGPRAWGTVAGNLALAGVMLLATVITVGTILLGERVFRVKGEEESRKAFCGLNFVGLGFLGLIVFYLARSFLLLIGLLEKGKPPPEFMSRIFGAG